MASELRIGLIGLDTSHVTRFAAILNDPASPHHLAGARVTAGFPGASSDFELSHSRVQGFTDELRGRYGVDIMSSPKAVAEAVDLLFITSVDGRRHRGFLEATIGCRRPTFVDKPFATSLSDAEAMFDLAGSEGVPLMSCSSLRYADNFAAALGEEEMGRIVGCDTYGPMNVEPTQGGLFFYGIHCVEMLVAALGAGCLWVLDKANAQSDLIAAEWSGGRTALMRGQRGAETRFAVTLHREKGSRFVDITATQRPYYVSMLEAILDSLPQGRSDVPAEETLEIIRLIEAANASRLTGDPVNLPR